MPIELRPYDHHSAAGRRTRALYRAAFPPAERPPFFLLRRHARRDGVAFYTVHDGDTWVGFTYVIASDTLAYVFFLAMDPAARGRGYGSAVLAALRERYAGRCLFLAVERLDEEDAPNRAERLRRQAFYEKNGFHLLPGKLREGRVVYDLMGTGEPPTREGHRALMDAYLGPLFRRLIRIELL